MKKLLTAITATLLLSTAASAATIETTTIAKKQVKMVAMNQEEASEVCILAAKEGFKVASKKFKTAKTDIKCNGLTVKSFAKKYKNVTVL